MSDRIKAPLRFHITRGRDVVILVLLTALTLSIIVGAFSYLGRFLWRSGANLMDEIYVHATYEPVEGRILDLKAEPGRTPEVTYTYSVKDRVFLGNQFHASPILHYRPFSASLADDYKPGDAVTVWVDPGVPQRSVLSNRLTVAPLSIGLLPCAVFVVLGTGLLLARTRQRSLQENRRIARARQLQPGAVPLTRCISRLVRRDGPSSLVITNQTPFRFVLLTSLLLASIGTIFLTIPLGSVFLGDVLPAGGCLFVVLFLLMLAGRLRHTRVTVDQATRSVYQSRHGLLRSTLRRAEWTEMAPAELEWRPVSPYLAGGKPRSWWNHLELYFVLRTSLGEKMLESRVWRSAEKDGARYLVRRFNYLLRDGGESSKGLNAA